VATKMGEPQFQRQAADTPKVFASARLPLQGGAETKSGSQIKTRLPFRYHGN